MVNPIMATITNGVSCISGTWVITVGLGAIVNFIAAVSALHHW